MNEIEQKKFINNILRGYLDKRVIDKFLTEATVNATEKALRATWSYDHEAIGKHSEILFTPKASSTGAEGTMFYDSDDDSVYVATE